MKSFLRRSATYLRISLNRNYGSKKIPWRDDPNYAAELPVFKYPTAKPSDRRVYAWGLAELGALGIHKKTRKIAEIKRKVSETHFPVRMTFAELYDVTHIAAGYGFSAFAVKTKDHYKVFGTGLNSDSQIGFHDPRYGHPLETILMPAPVRLPLKSPESTKVIGLSAGRAHLVVLTDSEGVFTLGNNSYGQCGRRTVPNEDYRKKVTFTNISHIKGEKIVRIGCGQDHSMFITESGKVFACGWGADGQLGDGLYETGHGIVRVAGDIDEEKIIKVTSSSDCVLALSEKGQVFGWGNNEYGQLGSLSASQQIGKAVRLDFCDKLGKITDVAAGGTHCLVLTESGDVFVWGFGILGLGPRAERSDRPLKIPETLFGRNVFDSKSRVRKIYAGVSHSAAVTNDGDLYVWGKNAHGCLGLGNAKDQFFPLRACVPARVLDLACGVDHTIAVCKPYI